MPVVVRHRNAVYSASDRKVLFYQFWAPREGTAPTPPLPPLVVLHGHGEHGGRYKNLVDRLTPEGWPLFIPDLRGHGWSEGKRGHVPRWDQYLLDVEALVRVVQRTHPGPFFLLGHSMGGLIALRYAEEHPSEILGLVLSGALLRLELEVPAWKAMLGNVLSNLWPTFSMPTGLPAKFLSHDPAVVEAYERDPKVHDRATARWFTELQGAMRAAWEKAPALKVPTLLLHGSDDRLTDPDGSRDLARTLGAGDRTLKIYEGFYHEPHNERDHARVLTDIEGWLRARLPAQAQGGPAAA